MHIQKIVGSKLERLNWNVVMAVMAVLFLALVICPLLLIGRYDFASCDDFSYGGETYKAFLEMKSFFFVLKSALEKVKEVYGSWQGTYSAIFLMTLNPAVWGDEVYHITPYIMIFILVFSEVVLGKFILHKICKADWPATITITAIIIGCQILWVPYPVETFFWFNGASYYTLFYSVMILYLVSIADNFMLGSLKSALFYMPLLLAGSVFLGGGNYPTALLTLEILACMGVWVFLKNRKNFIPFLVNAVFLLAGFVISMIAPGNAVRQQANVKTPVIESIYKSFKAGGQYIVSWTTFSSILLFLLLMPFLWKAIRRCTYKFKYPLLFSFFSMGLFCSQFTPTIYAQSFAGPRRLLNIIYYSYYLLMAVNITYWLGWAKRKLDTQLQGKNEITAYALFSGIFKKYLIPYMTVIALLYFFSLKNYGTDKLSSFSAFFSLRDGAAEKYYQEHLDRQKILMDDSELCLGIPEFTVKPWVLYFDDIEADASNWKNTATAKYYGKESIWLISQ